MPSFYQRMLWYLTFMFFGNAIIDNRFKPEDMPTTNVLVTVAYFATMFFIINWAVPSDD